MNGFLNLTRSIVVDSVRLFGGCIANKNTYICFRLELKSSSVKVFPDTSSTYSIRQALQRRFGIMWKYLCKDQFRPRTSTNDFCAKQYRTRTYCFTVRIVKDPEPPSVPPTKKQVDDLFQWFDDDEVVPIPPVVPVTPPNWVAAE
ncbi:hypothetical protein Tco_1161871 [Tanacetum coccineum]